ncbi:DUF3179 domain-containing protein [Marivirga sp.]|uniref:DUF3179 domain-containing protein n=1 Tax=Marivirga sp. TaxID=2018662 RepID=UPI003DA6D5A1
MKPINLTFVLTLIVMSLFSQSCDDDGLLPNNNGGDDDWLINRDDVFDGGPGKDGIPAIDNPNFINASEATFLSDDDLIVGYLENGEVKAYPHQILDWHEIINDESSNSKFSVIYCPLTGTATAWSRNTSQGLTTFGVSGLLYNTNVIPYDRNTDSNWSQIYLKAVSGDLAGEKPNTVPIIETTWATWKNMYPDSKVVSRNTGFNRNYDRYPYGNYKTNHDNILFPVSESDNRLPAKERVLTVIFDKEAKAYPIKEFENNVTIIEDDSFHEIVVVGSQEHNFAVAFENITTDGQQLSFTAISNQFPLVMEDDEGNKWNVFGEAKEGSRTGEKLPYADQMIGYWFSFPSFYEDLKLYEN